jgi:hypothetical protein
VRCTALSCDAGLSVVRHSKVRIVVLYCVVLSGAVVPGAVKQCFVKQGIINLFNEENL